MTFTLSAKKCLVKWIDNIKKSTIKNPFLMIPFKMGCNGLEFRKEYIINKWNDVDQIRFKLSAMKSN